MSFVFNPHLAFDRAVSSVDDTLGQLARILLLESAGSFDRGGANPSVFGAPEAHGISRTRKRKLLEAKGSGKAHQRARQQHHHHRGGYDDEDNDSDVDDGSHDHDLDTRGADVVSFSRFPCLSYFRLNRKQTTRLTDGDHTGAAEQNPAALAARATSLLLNNGRMAGGLWWFNRNGWRLASEVFQRRIPTSTKLTDDGASPSVQISGALDSIGPTLPQARDDARAWLKVIEKAAGNKRQATRYVVLEAAWSNIRLGLVEEGYQVASRCVQVAPYSEDSYFLGCVAVLATMVWITKVIANKRETSESVKFRWDPDFFSEGDFALIFYRDATINFDASNRAAGGFQNDFFVLLYSKLLSVKKDFTGLRALLMTFRERAPKNPNAHRYLLESFQRGEIEDKEQEWPRVAETLLEKDRACDPLLALVPLCEAWENHPMVDGETKSRQIVELISLHLDVAHGDKWCWETLAYHVLTMKNHDEQGHDLFWESRRRWWLSFHAQFRGYRGDLTECETEVTETQLFKCLALSRIFGPSQQYLHIFPILWFRHMPRETLAPRRRAVVATVCAGLQTLGVRAEDVFGEDNWWMSTDGDRPDEGEGGEDKDEAESATEKEEEDDAAGQEESGVRTAKPAARESPLLFSPSPPPSSPSGLSQGILTQAAPKAVVSANRPSGLLDSDDDDDDVPLQMRQRQASVSASRGSTSSHRGQARWPPPVMVGPPIGMPELGPTDWNSSVESLWALRYATQSDSESDGDLAVLPPKRKRTKPVPGRGRGRPRRLKVHVDKEDAAES
ncbi:hypothetical protein DFJ73DRAFT_809053 [Zopfochytrium polystomum]|nr:hypothetical protein DFJ73DRAFT_809053 [Zopfochytrium polystomum]